MCAEERLDIYIYIVVMLFTLVSSYSLLPLRCPPVSLVLL